METRKYSRRATKLGHDDRPGSLVLMVVFVITIVLAIPLLLFGWQLTRLTSPIPEDQCG